MAEYQILPNPQKAVLEEFGLNKVKYNIYQKGIGLLDKTGLKIPAQAAFEYGLSQVYIPGVNHYTEDTNILINQSKSMFSEVPKSALGTPVFSQLKFTTTKDASNPIYTNTNEIDIIHEFPIDCCLFTVSQEKNIVKTAIQGRNGTIKEYIGDGDYSINIKGIINGKFNMNYSYSKKDTGQKAHENVYPYYEVKNLLQFLRQPKELAIDVPFLNEMFGIMHIVIESYDFPQNEGGYGYQSFSINAVSDQTTYFTNINKTIDTQNNTNLIA